MLEMRTMEPGPGSGEHQPHGRSCGMKRRECVQLHGGGPAFGGHVMQRAVPKAPP